MGTQNLNNYYFKKVDANISYDSYYDIFLASDEKDYNEQVVHSNDIIDFNDGDKLPVWIDLNSINCSTQPTTDCDFQFTTQDTPTYYSDANYRPFIIVSQNQWSKAKSTCDCTPKSLTETTGGTALPVVEGFKICDGFWTNLDNGLSNYVSASLANTPVSGIPGQVNHPGIDCITLHDVVVNPFEPFQYDKRFKMQQVKAFGHPMPDINTFYTDTTILNKQDYSGYYEELCGGFYQGFYKLYGYPYEVLPTRPNKGWSFETYLKIKPIGQSLVGPISNPNSTGGVYGNCYNTSGFNQFGPFNFNPPVGFDVASSVCCSPLVNDWPQHQLNYSSKGSNGFFQIGRTDKYGFFFYKGIRAEDKYFNKKERIYLGGNINLAPGFQSWLPNISGCTTLDKQLNCCDEYEDVVNLVGENMSPNATYDVYSNALGFRITDDMRIGYRTIRYTGSCVTTGDTCDSGNTFDCGYKIEESYSDKICEFITSAGDCEETWVQVDVVFNRNRHLEDCEIHNHGGVNDLIRSEANDNSKNCDEEYPNFVKEAYFDFNCFGSKVGSWFEEKDSRLGTLTFYINGRRVHTVHDFEEIIPRQLNTNKQTQVGVAYNMSWGGGALGLREVLYPTTCDPNTTNFTNDIPHFDQTLIADNFGGSFIGGISQMMYYIKPLTPDEIYHNFKINKDRYKLVDCERRVNCPECNEKPIESLLP